MSALFAPTNKPNCWLTLSLIFILIVDTNEIVNVAVYYASLCPYSRNYMINQFIPTWYKLSSIMSVSISPFGNCYIKIINNSTEPPDVEIDCQHGLQEFIGNSIMVSTVDNILNML